MPLGAHGADGGRGIPPQHVRWSRPPHISLDGRLCNQARCLRKAKGEVDALFFIELGGLLENAGKDFVGEVVEVHWIMSSCWGSGGVECWMAETKGGEGGECGRLRGLYINHEHEAWKRTLNCSAVISETWAARAGAVPALVKQQQQGPIFAGSNRGDSSADRRGWRHGLGLDALPHGGLARRTVGGSDSGADHLVRRASCSRVPLTPIKFPKGKDPER